MKKQEGLLHVGVRVLEMHPTLGPGPYLTMCKKYFRNDLNAPVAKPPSKANCKECLKEYNRVLREAKKSAAAMQFDAA